MNKLLYVVVFILLGPLTCTHPLTELDCQKTIIIMSKAGDTNSQTETETEKRTRTLTEKGAEIYEARKSEYELKIQKAWDPVAQFLSDNLVFPSPSSLETLNELEKELNKLFSTYKKLIQEYIAYLLRVSTQDSLLVSQKFQSQFINSLKVYTDFNNRLKDLKGMHKETSHASSGSHTTSSRISSVLAVKQAALEAAKVRTEYAARENVLKKEKAQIIEQQAIAKAARVRRKEELEADIDFLNQEKELAACAAETQALETRSNKSVLQGIKSLPVDDPLERVEQFVEKQNALKNEVIEITSTESSTSYITVKEENYKDVPTPVVKSENQVVKPRNEFSESCAADFTKFLLRKDLTLSRLYQFNDKPESFRVWKCSFNEVVKELGVTPSEEVDLLIKWLGPESKKQALSIRSCYSYNPQKALEKVWERLEDRYGAPEMVYSTVLKKLNEFPKIGPKENEKLFQLSDILGEVEALKGDPKYDMMLSYFDSSVGISPIVSKLPFNLQEKWTTRANNFKKDHNVTYPRFWVFTEFVHDQAKIRNDPGFIYTQIPSEKPQIHSQKKTFISAKKTDVKKENKSETNGDAPRCPMHKTKHSIHNCRGFKSLSFEERRAFLKNNHLCFKCCASTDHGARECKQKIKCGDCGSESHCTAMHIYKDKSDQSVHGGEEETPRKTVTSKCTQICGNKQYLDGKSCAKLVLVNIYQSTDTRSDHKLKAYAILDEQSNRSLAKPELFSKLHIKSELFEYTLKTCSDTVVKSGRRAQNCVVESLDGSVSYRLPTLIECSQIPNIRDEIPSPCVAMHHPHLQDIASSIPEIDEEADILLLIGRDMIDAHHIIEQRTGPVGSPFAQRLGLGWVVIGEVCLGRVHQPDLVTCNKTFLIGENRASVCPPCPNKIKVKELPPFQHNDDNNIFIKTEQDDKVGLSAEDREFLSIMDSDFCMHSSGHWVAPLPFRQSRQRLPNNRPQALHRAKLLDSSLKSNSLKRSHFVTFMKEILDSGHAERAPPLSSTEECWYLPLFGVYHPKKPDQIRGVFDASAKYQGVSLNDVLLSGPDLTNSLLGVLIRFRKEPVAMTADIKKMFYCFLVSENHRNFLRFFWYLDNDPDSELVEYRMRVHVFGNSPSPAVASYGLRKIADRSKEDFGIDVQEFISNDFYVDDGLTSTPNVDTAVSLMKRTQQAFQEHGNIRLHKIASNSKEVMSSFPSEDLAKDLAVLDLNKDVLPLQRSLGLNWNLQTDVFTFCVSDEMKPYTRRGVLSTVNSIYDPIGFVAPVSVTGKLFLRELVTGTIDWDAPLPEDRRNDWESWRDSLILLEKMKIPRSYFGVALSDISRLELHIYSDASEKAIAAAAYCVGYRGEMILSKSLVMGKAKVAPKNGHTIPRLELCAAVLATEIYDTVLTESGLSFHETFFYSDSRVVLGYIQNKTRRFYTYVSNRVDKILRLTKPEQWLYINTADNPADCATRPGQVTNLMDSKWIHGPSNIQVHDKDQIKSFSLIDPDEDKEIRPVINTLDTSVLKPSLGSHRFERFSSWQHLVRALENLLHICLSFKHESDSDCRGWHMCKGAKDIRNKMQAEQLVIRTVQSEVYEEEMCALLQSKQVSKKSSLLKLNPILDDSGLLRVGGRLKHAQVPTNEKHPVIIPKNSHLAVLLIRYYHEKVRHQGRHFTEGAVRLAGYWIIGCKRLVCSIIQKCVKCRKLRQDVSSQKMSDLPADRVQPAPPFTFVGVDTFGPWEVTARRTRGGYANSKRWAILFTCLTSRAVHIEVTEELSSSAFINAFRRFLAIRGDVKEIRSDQGTNFVGATTDLGIDVVKVGVDPVQTFLHDKGILWTFNPPHSSHMGGVWERMIGVTRRILDSMLGDLNTTHLTHEVLTTFMAEVSAIINARPLVPISSDPDCPEILTPAMLLTQKCSTPVQYNYQPVSPKVQWKYVQALSDTFWKRWRTEYLQTLQNRRKWQADVPNLKHGDVVLLKDCSVHRNNWPMGVITRVFPSEDGRVRKAEVRVASRESGCSLFVRPISQLILLVSET